MDPDPSRPVDGDSNLRVVLDARIPDGSYGGVQQWVIGLAHGLSQLPDDGTEYLFLVHDDGAPWLAPHVSGPCRLLPPDPHPELVERNPSRGRMKRVSRPRRLLVRLRSTIHRLAQRSVEPEQNLEPAHHIGRVPMGPMPTTPGLPAIPRVKGATPWSDGTIEAARADVIHFTFQAAFRTSVPSIYQPWDLQHLHLPEFLTPEQHRRRAAAYPTFSRRASLVVVASQWVKDDVVAAFGIPADRIEVVPAPPPTDAYAEPDRAEADGIAAALGIPDRFVYYPAQTWPHKNHGRLFDALHRLRQQGTVVPLVSTGKRNAHYQALEQQARDLGILDQLLFLDYVDAAAVRVLYDRARALVFPSLYEGWGLPIVEAFRLGLPVACSNVTSLPELVGDAALVFDPLDPASIAEAVERIWTDDALAAQLAERGRTVAAQFDWAATAATMRGLYQRVAGCGQPPLDAGRARLPASQAGLAGGLLGTTP